MFSKELQKVAGNANWLPASEDCLSLSAGDQLLTSVNHYSHQSFYRTSLLLATASRNFFRASNSVSQALRQFGAALTACSLTGSLAPPFAADCAADNFKVPDPPMDRNLPRALF
jgi:hypothetical protein